MNNDSSFQTISLPKTDKQFHHKSQNYNNPPIISLINSDIQADDFYSLNNSKSSNQLSKIIEISNGDEILDGETEKKDKNFNINGKESCHLLKEYKENLEKFDNNISEIKNALTMLKKSLFNYKSQNEQDDEITSQVIIDSHHSIPEKKNDILENNSLKESLMTSPSLENLALPIKTIEYSDDSVYFGQILGESLKQGLGKFTFTNKGYYIGEWNNDEMSGYGSLMLESSICIYEGFWKNSKFNGIGIFRNIYQNQQNIEDIDYRNFNDLGDKWIKYEGEFDEDLMNGKGKLEFVNGDVFIGNFERNKIEGKGIFLKKSNGEKMIRIWKENMMMEDEKT